MTQMIFVLFLCMTLYSFVYLVEFPILLEAGWTFCLFTFLVQRYVLYQSQKMIVNEYSCVELTQYPCLFLTKTCLNKRYFKLHRKHVMDDNRYEGDERPSAKVMGSFLGQFHSVNAPDLAAPILEDCMNTTGLSGQDIQEVLLGCVLPAGRSGASSSSNVKSKITLPCWCDNH